MKHLFLKLHGAINWWMVDETLTYLPWSGGGVLAQKWATFDANADQPDKPVILEPSFYKYQDDAYNLLEPQWSSFFASLLEADCVICIGYSLPESDSYARSKIVTAFQVNQASKWLLIDSAESTRERYRRLLGQQRLKIIQMGLAGFNNDIRQNLQEAFPDIDFSEPATASHPHGPVA